MIQKVLIVLGLVGAVVSITSPLWIESPLLYPIVCFGGACLSAWMLRKAIQPRIRIGGISVIHVYYDENGNSCVREIPLLPKEEA